MKRLVALIVSVLAAPPVGAGELETPGPAYPLLARTAGTIGGFVPRGWSVETVARGDLNRDGRTDLAFVLLAPDRPGAPPRSSPYDDDPASYAAPRMLGIAFARPQGGYRLALSNHGFLPPKWAPNGLSQGWMLFQEGSLAVSRGRLRIIFEYTRGHSTFTFRWERETFRLIGYDSVGVSAGCLRLLSVNFLTNRAKMTAGYVDREEESIRWTRLAPRPRLALAEIGDGEEFDPYRLLTGSPLSCPEKEWD